MSLTIKMSFGFGVSDFVIVLKIAKEVYNACKDGPKEYQEISREAESFCTVFESLKNDANNSNSLLNKKGTDRRRELLQIIANCEVAFEELQALIDKHSRLDTEGRCRIWDSYQVGKANLGDIRGKLTFYASMIAIFMDSLGVSAMGRIEEKLDKLFAKVVEAETNTNPAKSTTSLASTISLLSVVESEQEDKVWDLIEYELQAEDVKLSTLNAHKADIIAYLRSLVEKTDIERLQHSQPIDDHNAVRPPSYQVPRLEMVAQTAGDELLLEREERPTILLRFGEDTETIITHQKLPGVGIQIRYTYRAQLGLYQNKPICFIVIQGHVQEKAKGPRIKSYQSHIFFSHKSSSVAHHGSVWRSVEPWAQEKQTDGSHEYMRLHEINPPWGYGVHAFRTCRDVESRLPSLHIGFMLPRIPEFPPNHKSQWLVLPNMELKNTENDCTQPFVWRPDACLSSNKQHMKVTPHHLLRRVEV